jgi:hypothetical protein
MCSIVGIGLNIYMNIDFTAPVTFCQENAFSIWELDSRYQVILEYFPY